MIDPPIPKPPTTLGPDQDRDLPCYQALTIQLTNLVSRMVMQGWTANECHFSLMSWSVRRITKTAHDINSPAAFAALDEIPEVVREQIDLQSAACRGDLPAIPSGH